MRDCNRCNGNGFLVPEHDLDDFELIQAEVESGLWDCHMCNGTGEVEDVDLEDWVDD